MTESATLEILAPPSNDWTGFYVWLRWYDGLGEYAVYGKRNPTVRPKVPVNIKYSRPLWFPRREVWWFLRNHGNGKPIMPSIYSELGGFVSQCGSFPFDSPGGREFVKQGGKWLSYQIGDHRTHKLNEYEITQRSWIQKWQYVGVKIVEPWWRVEHSPAKVPDTTWVKSDALPNPENATELAFMPGLMEGIYNMYPKQDHATITLGKMPGFPFDLLAKYDFFPILECFLEKPTSDHSVTNSVNWWLAHGVPLPRIKVALLFKTGFDSRVDMHMAEVRATGVKGVSAFVAENVPIDAWEHLAV